MPGHGDWKRRIDANHTNLYTAAKPVSDVAVDLHFQRYLAYPIPSFNFDKDPLVTHKHWVT